MKTLLDQINLTIHVWVSRTEHGKELTSNVRIVELFGMACQVIISVNVGII